MSTRSHQWCATLRAQKTSDNWHTLALHTARGSAASSRAARRLRSGLRAEEVDRPPGRDALGLEPAARRDDLELGESVAQPRGHRANLVRKAALKRARLPSRGQLALLDTLRPSSTLLPSLACPPPLRRHQHVAQPVGERPAEGRERLEQPLVLLEAGGGAATAAAR